MKETNIKNLKNHFLVALPVLEKSIFEHSVSLICQHNKDGAMGLIINKVSNFKLSDILPKLDIKPNTGEFLNTPVFFGGPVNLNNSFVLHSPVDNWNNTIKVNQKVAISCSKDIIEAIAEGRGPDNYIITLGCASWDKGQLEQELIYNSWLTTPYDDEILFSQEINEKWHLSTNKLGLDINKISQFSGRA